MLGKLALFQKYLTDSGKVEEPLVNYRSNWYQLVRQFTALELTYHSDRLAAFSGLAKRFQGTSDEYICGLWSGDFVKGLLWYVRDPTRVFRTSYRQEYYQAPSWSWASITGSVIYDRNWWMIDNDFAEFAEILEIEYSLATPNPFGAVSSASITVRGFLLAIQLNVKWCIHLDLDGLQKFRMPLGRIILDVHAGEMTQHTNIVQEPLFLCVLRRVNKVFRPSGIILRAVGDASELRTF